MKPELARFVCDPALLLYLPLYELDGAQFQSKDARGAPVVPSGTFWTPQGYFLDGIDDQINTGVSLSGFEALMSTAAWVKFTSINPNKVVIGKALSADSSWPMHLRINGNTVLSATCRVSPGTNVHAEGPAPLVNVWYFMVGVYDQRLTGNNLKLYVNGQLTSQINQLTAISVNTNNWFVGSVSGNLYMNGLVGETWIFGRALYATEIRDMFLVTRDRYA